ncbi:MAG: hypothetical protein HY644_15160 [Acidobacteria bacterium]|nr:hypothetical protein [Acidobacteriota bacterium]
MAKRLALIFLAVLLVSGLFYYLTISSVRHECEIVFEYKGRSVTTRASGATQEDALRTAVTAACGQITSGMSELIQCENTPPKSVVCK